MKANRKGPPKRVRMRLSRYEFERAAIAASPRMSLASMRACRRVLVHGDSAYKAAHACGIGEAALSRHLTRLENWIAGQKLQNSWRPIAAEVINENLPD